MSKQMGICFHPTDTELINYLKRFFKGELSLNQQCPIQFADIYGDQPPWEIFGANFEEKFRCFITPLKKLKTEYKRFSRICAKGTWKGQTGEHLTRRNRTAPVVGFKRNLKFETNYSSREDQVRFCDEQDAVEATTSEYDVQNSTYEATTMEKRETTLEVEESHGVDDIRSDEFQEEMYRAFEGIPDDWLQNSTVLQDI
ncbi:uncharacterized protein [Solanum tuberosum]|uniref:uncharacterized protein n=1 Tax=Solanum tuberosum TaxID=4113 RepID=UPI00073A0551|nr:PREDICTED: uncharacterized protein LOC107060141 [Solanum tuberosum]